MTWYMWHEKELPMVQLIMDNYVDNIAHFSLMISLNWGDTTGCTCIHLWCFVHFRWMISYKILVISLVNINALLILDWWAVVSLGYDMVCFVHFRLISSYKFGLGLITLVMMCFVHFRLTSSYTFWVRVLVMMCFVHFRLMSSYFLRVH